MRKCLNCKCFEAPAPYTCCQAPRFRKPRAETPEEVARQNRLLALVARYADEE